MPSFLDTIAATILTYAVHSAAACVIALLVARYMRRPQDRDLVWKATLVAPIFTTLGVMLAGNRRGAGSLIDLAVLLSRGTSWPLPGRRVMVHVTNDGFRDEVVRQFTDPVTTALTMSVFCIVSVCVA